MPKQKIFLAADHAGFKLKACIKKFLADSGYEVEDMGAEKYDKEDDYPDYIIPAAKKVASNPNAKGIIFGGSGQGEAIAANKVKGIKAALYYGSNLDIVRLSRTHNDSNILSLGARFLKKEEAIEAVKTWLNSHFTDEPSHKRRIKKISDVE